MPDNTPTPEIVNIVKTINEIQEGLKNVATLDKIKALSDQFMAFQTAKDNQRRAEAKHRIFGDQATFDSVAACIGKALGDAGLLNDKPADNYWNKALTLAKTSGLNSADSTAGSTFLPTVIDPVISKLVNQNGVARRDCRVVPNIMGTLSINKRGTRVTVSGQSRGDATISPAATTYGTPVSLTPKEVSAITTVEEKLIWDSPIAVVEEAISDLAEAVAEFEDDTLFNGTGTTAYLGFTGIKTASNVGEVTVSADNITDFDFFLDLREQVHASILRDPDRAFYSHPYNIAYAMTLKNVTTGLYYFDPSRAQFVLNGDRIEFVPVMDSTRNTIGNVLAVFGSLRKAVALGLGRPGSLKVLTELYAASNSIGLRFTYDIGLAVVQPTAIARSVVAAS